MRPIERTITPQLVRAARNFPAVVLTGPRRAGKTWCLRHVFPRATWHLLEDPDVLDQVKSDPRGFLDGLQGPAIIDEIQNAPELFPANQMIAAGRELAKLASEMNERSRAFITG